MSAPTAIDGASRVAIKGWIKKVDKASSGEFRKKPDEGVPPAEFVEKSVTAKPKRSMARPQVNDRAKSKLYGD